MVASSWLSILFTQTAVRASSKNCIVLEQLTVKNVLMLLLIQVRGGPAMKRKKKKTKTSSLHLFHF
jgi:hypothetical protein